MTKIWNVENNENEPKIAPLNGVVQRSNVFNNFPLIHIYRVCVLFSGGGEILCEREREKNN
jgi:hypothetical protein